MIVSSVDGCGCAGLPGTVVAQQCPEDVDQ
ncbi:hypothetical protein EV191_1151, partial [Tamaricihabitans halophyticus]